MALKRKITKDAFDKLADNIKFEYVADGDNYVLQTEGDEDIGPLKRANQRLKDQVEHLEGKNDELAGKLDKIEKNPARKQGDIDALERQWAKDTETKVGEVTAKLEKANSFIKQSLLENAASSLAEKISTSPAIIRPHIERRLTVDIDGDAPVVKVLGADGKASALTVEKLGEEFVANKDFSSIIRVTKASGGAGSPSSNGGAVKPTGQGQPPASGEQPPNLATMNPRDLAATIQAKKAEQQQAQ
ncbi:scaffold protein [Xanthomonas phage Langgrundblatt1]|uniref:Scaffold protein n=1 Tax=Xanthomonas phage Langgrundblatt1 TaxID=2939128 RepID=A0A9E7E2Y0_9CAUD|nr:scaffold protein [Xanthomonas phage Langgrundblatt1]URA06795.1 scaffold protein [Xanthomonas phage Langgrundblatt1]